MTIRERIFTTIMAYVCGILIGMGMPEIPRAIRPGFQLAGYLLAVATGVILVVRRPGRRNSR